VPESPAMAEHVLRFHTGMIPLGADLILSPKPIA